MKRLDNEVELKKEQEEQHAKFEQLHRDEEDRIKREKQSESYRIQQEDMLR